jgi:hypothetical protein
MHLLVEVISFLATLAFLFFIHLRIRKWTQKRDREKFRKEFGKYPEEFFEDSVRPDQFRPRFPG